MRARAGIAAASAAALCVLAGAAAAAPTQRFFFSAPPVKASCELDVGVPGLPDGAHCLVGPPQVAEHAAVSVDLSASGKVGICRGLRCIGNAPEHTPTIGAGKSVTLGPFECTSLRTGVRCVVTRLGHGFVLGLHGAERV